MSKTTTTRAAVETAVKDAADAFQRALAALDAREVAVREAEAAAEKERKRLADYDAKLNRVHAALLTQIGE